MTTEPKNRKSRSLPSRTTDPREIWEAVDRVWMNHANGTRILNPVMVAHIMELASLDGDVPEFRVGQIPEGGKPAVPVETDSLNSTEIGMKLELASKMVASALAEKLALTVEDAPLKRENTDVETRGVGVEGYEPGRKAQMVKVRELSPLEVGQVRDEERVGYIYKVVSTTQGRISASASIEKNLKRMLSENDGIEVEPGEPGEGATRVEWTMTCSGKEDLSPNWDPVATAAKRMYVEAKLVCKGPKSFIIKVDPISDVQNRRFGWSLRMEAKGI